MIKETKTNLPIDEAIYEQGYNQAIKDLDNFDWQAFRREAAKDILASISKTFISIEDAYIQECIAFSIKLADELIKQLKEEEGK